VDTHAPELPRLYRDLAPWFHLLTHPKDYAEETEFYASLMRETASIPVHEVVELGSGGGNMASHMKRHFALTLSDISDGMLAISRELNPEVPHVQGDMRSVDLGRQFDAVFVHDAVEYLLAEDDLRQLIQNADRHCRPGGCVLIAPDAVKETWQPRTDSGGHDAPDGRGLRYLEWSYDPDPVDTTFVCDMAYLIREADGTMHCEYDRHVLGLFSRDTWLTLFREAGLEARVVPLVHSEVAPGEVEVFAAAKPL
jgi:SAM-dependent methyltransferase